MVCTPERNYNTSHSLWSNGNSSTVIHIMHYAITRKFDAKLEFILTNNRNFGNLAYAIHYRITSFT